jgi:anti-anti-sigma regulatory factor
MRWRRATHRTAPPRAAAEPVVLPIDRVLTRTVAADLTGQIDRLAGDVPVVIDLTGIAGFDSDGATELLDLQERVGRDRLTIVGFRQAAARLVGSDTVDVPTLATVAPVASAEPVASVAADRGWVVRRLRNLAVVQPSDGDLLSTDDLEPVLTTAIAEDVAIVVVDLRNTTGLSPLGLQALTFASSSAAVRGQELLVVNVDSGAAEALRRSGLSATTYVAPEPLGAEPLGPAPTGPAPLGPAPLETPGP